MAVLNNTKIQKNETDFMALCLYDIADEVENFLPYEAHSLRNMAKKLAASSN